MRRGGNGFPLLQLYVIGFLLGVLSAVLLGQGGEGLSISNVSRVMERSNKGVALLPYVILSRGGWSVFMILAGTTYLSRAANVFFLSWLGMSMGNMSMSCILRYGLQGFPLLYGLLFPQWLLYLPAFLLLASWSDSLHENICLEGAPLRTGFVIRLIGITIMMAMGMALECF